MPLLPQFSYAPELRPLLRGWLYLALASLVVPGITAILLVVLRTISADAASGWGDLFRAALVVHVDLSVFIWFLSVAGLLWSACGSNSHLRLKWIAFWLVTTGTTIIAFAPLLGATEAVLNNYIPVLNHPLFFVGLGLVALGLTLATLIHLLLKPQEAMKTVRRGMDAVALSTLLAITVALTTGVALWGQPLTHHFFEQLFWGGGHILQFTYVLLLLVGWKMIADALQLMPQYFQRNRMQWLYLAALLPLLTVPWLYLQYSPLAPEITVGFAELMRYGNGIAPGIMGLLLLLAIWKTPSQHKVPQKDPLQAPIRAALYASMLLFASGGIIALFISGINTIIPAHYHGSIVGITLALMGVIYLLLPALGFSAAEGRMATLQPYTYALGQLMHIAGLALSGSEGAQRKTAGVSGEAMNSAVEQMGLLLTRSGGLIAVVGGMLFLLVCWKAIRTPPTTQAG